MQNTTTEFQADRLAEQISLAWSNWITVESRQKRKTGTPYVQANVWAGQFSPCARQLVLRMLYSQDLPAWTPEQLARFRRGNDRERDLLSDLKRIGRDCTPSFEIIEEQRRFELSDTKSRVVITGKVDAMIQFAGMHPVPLEVKAWSPMLVAKVHSFADLFDNRWTRKGAYQLLSYLYGAAQEIGFLVIDRSGLPMVLPVQLYEHIERVEEFLTLAETAMDHKEAGTLPDYIQRPSECKICDWFGSRCTPPLLSGQGATVLNDEELAAVLDRRAEVEAAGKEYSRLDDQAKKQLRGVELGLCGNWLIEGEYGSFTKTIWPDEETKKRCQVKDPQGKFTLKFTRIGLDKETIE